MNLQQLQNLTLQWRASLLPKLYEDCQGQVQSGPFKGIQLLPLTCWGDGDTASKLLGLYEDELHDYIHRVQAPDLVINVGCAEGYYAVGLARKFACRTIAADSDARAQDITAQTAQANHVTVETTGTLTAQDLQQLIGSHARVFVFMDCEGAEQALLDLDLVPGLKNATVLVESHDCLVTDITNTLVKRFENTHDCEVIRAQGKNPWQFPMLDKYWDLEKLILVNECRPETAIWIWMEPK